MSAENLSPDFSCYDLIITKELKLEKEQETVIPDTLPDGGEIIDCCPSLYMRTKEVFDGLVRLQVMVQTSVVVRCDDGSLNTVEQSITADFDLADEKVRSECICDSMANITAAECWLTNPRKIAVKLDIYAKLDVYAPGRQECIQPEKTEGLYFRRRSVTASSVVSLREKTFVLTDELVLPQQRQPMQTILSKNVLPVVEEVKPISEKLMVKGRVQTDILYLGMDKCTYSCSFSTPFSQLVDLGGAEGDICAVGTAALTGAYFDLEPDSDGRRIKQEIHLLLQTCAHRKFDYEYICDAYSNASVIDLKTKTSTLCLRNAPQKKDCSFDKTMELPIPAEEIIACRACMGSGHTLWVSIIYKSSEGQICAAKRRIEAETGELDGVLNAWVDDCQAGICDQGASLHITVSTCCQTEEKSEICEIVSCEETGPITKKRPSVTLLHATNRDDLWTIAKNNSSCVEVIRDINGLGDDSEEWDKVILVPKCK